MRTVLSPPTFLDAETNRKAAILFKIIRGVLVIATITNVALYIGNPQSVVRLAVQLCFYWAVGIVCLTLLHRGHVKAGTLLYLVFLFVIDFGSSWTGGGIKGHSIQFIPVVVLFAGITLGRQALWVCGVIASLCGGGLVAADYYNLLPVTEPIGTTPFVYWVIVSASIGLICILETMSVRSLDKALHEARQELELRRKSEQKASALLNLSFGFIGMLKPDGTLVDANKTALDFIGKDLSDVSGKPFWETPWWDHSPDIQEQIRLAVEGAAQGNLARMETTLLLRDGVLHAFDLTIKPVLDESGTVTMLIPEGRDITERKRAEEALKKNEEYRKRIFDSSRVPIVIMDAETNAYVDCNAAAVAMYHFSSREEVLGRSPLDFSAPVQYDGTPSPEKALQYIEKAMVEGAVVFDWRHQGPDGEIWDAEVHLMSFESDKQRYLQFTLQDITKRRRTEAALIAEKTFNKMLIDLSPAFFVAIDRNGRTIMMNDSMLRALGYTSAEVEGKDYCANFVAEADRNELVQVFSRISEQKEITVNVNRILARDGRELTCEWHGVPVFQKGTYDFFIGVGIDVTERKKTEMALHESEERYRSLFEGVPIGLYRVTPFGRILDFNRAASEMLGFDRREDVLALMASDLYVNPEEQRRHADAMIKFGMNVFEAQVYTRNKNIIWIRNRGNVVVDGRGQILYFEGSIEDITGRKQAEEALRENEIKFRTMFENSRDAISVSKNGIQVFANPAMYKLYKYENSEDLSGRSVLEHVAHSHHPQIKDYMRRRSAGEPAPSFYETRGLRQDGTEFDEEVNIASYELQGEIYSMAIIRDISERKKAEIALRESEALYHTLYEHAPVGIFYSTIEGKIVRVNDEYARMMGYDSPAEVKEMINRSTIAESIYVQSDERSGVIEKVVSNPGTWIKTEKQFRRKDGRPITTNLIIRALPDNPAQLEGFLEDITERKRAERALRESEERYRRLLESVTGYVYTVVVRDGNRVNTIHNPGCVVVTGYQPEEYAENPNLWIDMIPNDDRQNVLGAVEKVLREVLPVSLEHRIIHKKEGLRWVSATLVPHTDQAGSIVSYDGLITDITDRKVAEAALRESDERFRQMAENIEEVFFLYQKEGNKLLYMSPVIARLFGVDASVIKADPQMIDRAVHPDDVPNVKFTRYEQFYSTPLDEEFRIITPDGAVHWIRLRSFLICNLQGDVVRVAGLAADITGHKLSIEKERLHNEQLQQADKMASLGVLVSGVAHEVNNPNNFIMLNTPLLIDAWEQAKPILESYYETHGEFDLGGIPFSEMRTTIPALFQGIEDGSRRIKRIVEDLKNFARKDVSSYENVIDVNQVVREAVSLLASMIAKKTNRFSVTLPDVPIFVKGNKQKLEQVVINLIHNACDALESKEQALKVCVEGFTSECIISVVDQGKGISKSDLAHLTEPFFTSKRDIGGTGLGLSVSAGIVKEHNGKLLFESEIGKGTKASVVLPIPHVKEVGYHECQTHHYP